MLIVICDFYNKPIDYHEFNIFIHGKFENSFFQLSEFPYIVDTNINADDVHKEIVKCFKSPKDKAYVFNLNPETFCSVSGHGDVESWLRARLVDNS